MVLPCMSLRPPDGSEIELAVAPDSERIQLMQPWPAWDGSDFTDMPVLMKTQGKTHRPYLPCRSLLPALSRTPRQVQRQHVYGRDQRYTGDPGTGKNIVTGEEGKAISAIARNYQSQGVKWVVVGDDNYGEGSSREHAALSPRLLGGGGGHRPQFSLASTSQT